MNKHWTDKSKGMNDLADRIAGLSPAKRALIELRLKTKGLVVSGEQRIPQREKRSSAPLSFAQERFWVLDQFHTNSTVFNCPFGFRLRGPLQLEVFRESVQALVDRHEILRTTFASVDGGPHQVIAPTLSVEVPLRNCSGLSKEERAGMIQQAFLEEKRFQFDLAHGPLFRARLLRFAEDDHFLMLNLHHIIHDAWSLEVIIKDLVTAYTAGFTGHAVALPALPIQYVDYAHWQRRLLEGPIGREQLAFWKTQLAQLPPALPLPTDYARPAVQTFRGAREDLQLPAELLAPLRALNRQEGTTLFMVLLATFQFHLHRLTGTHDILVGSPIAGRDQQELHGLIGCFINTLVMRTDLSGDLTGRDLLQRVREVVLNAYENQDVPFEKILAEVDPARDLSRTPIFQVMLNMHSFDDQNLPLPELSVTRVHSTDNNSLFDMTLYFLESFDEIQLILYYNADLFTAERMTEFMRQFQGILEQMINDPDRPLEALTLVTPSARLYLPDPQQPLDAEWEGPVWRRLEHHAHRQGEAIAMVSPGETWTYQELEFRSNQLAHCLLGQGVHAQEVVAIYASRSPELVLALFGILKAGAAFMILDPSYPSSRLMEMLQIARPCGFIHLEEAGPLPDEVDAWAARVPCRFRLPAFAATETDFEELWGSTPKTAPGVKVQPDDVAYVTFTSGSTGIPKCLQGTHRPLSHFMRWYTEVLQLTAADRVTMFSGLAHDPLLRDVFAPLWIGGTLCIPDQEALASGRVGDWMNEQKITLMHLTPPLVDVLTVGRETSQVSCNSLRYAVFGGESLRPVHLDCIKQLAPQATCVNGYGATETPQIMCWYLVPPEFPSNREQVPIGQGIDGVQILVLNNTGQLTGIGELGEIYIRTPYLTLGYVNDEALTSARFLPNPFRPEAEDRIYRTGDMGRLLPDGSIEFVGRKDFQVKIRGFRIEVGEIEVVLGQHPAVGEVVLVPGEDSHGERHLVAYLVINENPSPSISEIRSFLRQKLSEYMIPSAFVFLNALPRTPNGKVDHRALPGPDVVRPDLQEAFVAPRSQSEELLAGIWSNVLGLERIGVYDGFFELGGHSLLVVQIISRIREVFEVELPLRALFEAPTVAGLTERIEAARRSDEGLQTSPLQAVSRDQELPLSFAQQRLWFLHHLEPDSVAYSMPRSIRLKGVLRKDALQNTYVELARRHETLRTAIHSTDDNPVLRIAAEPNILFDTLDLRHLPEVEREAEAKRLREEDARKPFDLAQDPLFRIKLFQLEDEAHVLHSNMHHIISDFWSFGVMDPEIAALYTAFIKGKPADLPELPVQYADYAVWQRQWLQGEALEAQLNYWKDKLGGELPVLELPTDRPRPAVQTHRGAIESLVLSKALSDALQAISRREGVTLFMTLLAAFKTLLYRLTGQEDTIVGTPIAGRNRTELEGLIGFFMNTIVMRTDLSGHPSFRELLGRVRETALGAYAHQDMPFEKLVEELSPERDLSRTPLFQVFFNHIVAMGDKAAQLPGLEAEAVGGLEDRESKFDMTLYVLEREGGIELRSSYNTDLFDSWRMAAMLKQYQMLLASIVSDSGQRISELSLLTEAERHQILVEWNDTAADYPEDKWIHTLFETQAEHSPEAMAVIFGDEQLSYHELNCRANQLAHYLRKHGVGSEEVVGICMERSPEMIIGLLAILKAGGAYVALEPDFPGARLSFMLEDTKPGLLLTQQRLLEKIPEYSGKVVCLDRDCKLFQNEQESSLKPISTPEDLAYVTYTSGSTGRPKGILASHRSVVQHLHDFIHRYSLRATDIVLQIPSFSFDASVRDIFGPLLAGARIVLVRNDEAKDPSALVAKIAENHVSCILSITPSLLTQLVEAGSQKSFSFAALRHISAAGEPLPMALCKRVQDVFGCSVVNQYGPTECTIISSYHRVVDLGGYRNIALIGRPIANTQFYVLDAHLNPVPVGVAGEAYIGGLGVARGYLNLPDLTAEMFIPNPFSNEPGARLYNTGDMVRYLPDGTMEFLGRRDFQVKLRGVRIELGEVEAALCLHPSVSEAVVVAREDRPGDKRLVAYVVAAAAESAPSTGVLRAFLQEKLPDYMIPSAFVFMDALPLTANRKVDRRALPGPDRMRPDLEEVFIAPRTQAEELVAGIWSNVLGVERIGVHDNFFELGGHSLLATRVVSRIQQEFNVDLKLMDFFKMPTIAELTKRLEGLLWINSGKPGEDEAELQDREEWVV